eukprot:43362_1
MALRFGFEYICKQFCEHYKDPNANNKLLEGVYLRPSRLTTNDVEKLFSKFRGMRTDGISQYAKGPAIMRTQQALSLQVKKRKASTSVLGKRTRGKGYKQAASNAK